MFWLDNIFELMNPVLTPDINMTIEDKINAIIRAIIFVGLICTLVFNDTRYVLFVIILMIISILIINYQYEKNKKIEKYLNLNDLDIVNNKKCIKPTENNPFMNPNILTTKKGNEDYEACSINNKNVNKNINKFFYQKIFRNADDIYDKSTLDRQFYTVPSTTIPNDREKLGEWLYVRGPTCKEGNGIKCYNNLYNNIKNGVQI
uniref:Minor capsid protein P9 transmembrane helices domain-containing protein n=1 Tax=Virus NIOZ-UU159 TaxID=2763270 RepID=A0A7S9SUH1_9VIRU|nr:MAG: hypothetical protein NIOZUU159_00050 [Virus NIOZ-UU159]